MQSREFGNSDPRVGLQLSLCRVCGGISRAATPIVRKLTLAMFWVGRSLELWLTLLGKTDQTIAESMIATVPIKTEPDRVASGNPGLALPAMDNGPRARLPSPSGLPRDKLG
jgi:hypothetical protein